jgi:YVTN family beta-propeller protein
MRRIALAMLAMAAVVSASAAPPLAQPPRTLSLGAPDRWKYVAFDPPSHALYVAHGTEITVVDADTLHIVGQVPGLSSAHGVAIVPGGHGYAASGKTGTVTVFDPSTLRVITTIPAGQDANAVSYDSVSRRVFVMNDDVSTVTVIDPATDTAVSTIPLMGGEGVEGAGVDGQGHLYVNHSAKGEVVRIDTARAAVDAAWTLPECAMPEGLAVDPALGRVFIGCGNARMLVLDARDGRTVATLPIGPGGGEVLLDAKRHYVYSANADGTLSVIEEQGPDHFVVRPGIATAPGARTGALDPASGRLYLVTADVAASLPPLLPGEAPLLRFAPGTMKLLVFDPAP